MFEQLIRPCLGFLKYHPRMIHFLSVSYSCTYLLSLASLIMTQKVFSVEIKHAKIQVRRQVFISTNLVVWGDSGTQEHTYTDQTYFLKKVIIGIKDIWQKDESISFVSLLALLGGYGVQWGRVILKFFLLKNGDFFGNILILQQFKFKLVEENQISSITLASLCFPCQC